MGRLLIAIAIVIAAAAYYFKPLPGRYQIAVSAKGTPARVDTVTGEVTSCKPGRDAFDSGLGPFGASTKYNCDPEKN